MAESAHRDHRRLSHVVIWREQIRLDCARSFNCDNIRRAGVFCIQLSPDGEGLCGHRLTSLSESKAWVSAIASVRGRRAIKLCASRLMISRSHHFEARADSWGKMETCTSRKMARLAVHNLHSALSHPLLFG